MQVARIRPGRDEENRSRERARPVLGKVGERCRIHKCPSQGFPVSCGTMAQGQDAGKWLSLPNVWNAWIDAFDFLHGE